MASNFILGKAIYRLPPIVKATLERLVMLGVTEIEATYALQGMSIRVLLVEITNGERKEYYENDEFNAGLETAVEEFMLGRDYHGFADAEEGTIQIDENGVLIKHFRLNLDKKPSQCIKFKQNKTKQLYVLPELKEIFTKKEEKEDPPGLEAELKLS